MVVVGDKNGTRKWHDFVFYQFFPLPLTSNHPIQVEEKLEGSENEMGDKPREPSQVNHIGKLAIANYWKQICSVDYSPLSSLVLEFEAPGAGREKAGIGCKSRMLHIVLIFNVESE